LRCSVSSCCSSGQYGLAGCLRVGCDGWVEVRVGGWACGNHAWWLRPRLRLRRLVACGGPPLPTRRAPLLTRCPAPPQVDCAEQGIPLGRVCQRPARVLHLCNHHRGACLGEGGTAAAASAAAQPRTYRQAWPARPRAGTDYGILPPD
jgi:hypothetical protein